MKELNAHLILDAKGLACPMPIVKTRKAIKDIDEGQILEVQATDKGSKTDIKAWAENTGNQYLGTIEDGKVLKHYLRKGSSEEAVEKKHPVIINNDDFERKLLEKDDIVVIDVREEAEYRFSHIPEAISIPLGELEDHLKELDKEKDLYVICRTGSRSDLAAQRLSKEGFTRVINVIPGMSNWTGEKTGINHEAL